MSLTKIDNYFQDKQNENNLFEKKIPPRITFNQKSNREYFFSKNFTGKSFQANQRPSIFTAVLRESEKNEKPDLSYPIASE